MKHLCVIHSQRLRLRFSIKSLRQNGYRTMGRSDFSPVAAIFPRKLTDAPKNLLTMNEALTLYYVCGTFSDLSTLETLNGSSSLNMHRIRPILVSFNAELNSKHFQPKICVPLEKVFDLIFPKRLEI